MILKLISGISALPFRNLASFKSTAAIALTTLVVVSMCMICKFASVEMRLHDRIFVVACMALMAVICGAWNMTPRTTKKRTRKLQQFNCYVVEKDLKGVEPFAIGDRVTPRYDPSYQGVVTQITHAVRDNGIEQFTRVTVEWDVRDTAPNGWPDNLLAHVAFSFGDRVKLCDAYNCLGTVQWHSKRDHPHKVKVLWDNSLIGIHQPAKLFVAFKVGDRVMLRHGPMRGGTVLHIDPPGGAKSQSDFAGWPSCRVEWDGDEFGTCGTHSPDRLVMDGDRL